MTLEELTKMIARGFEGTASREELRVFEGEVSQRFEKVDEEFRSVRGELGMFRNETISELKEIKTVLGPLVCICCRT